jgi:hypothetical protein
MSLVNAERIRLIIARTRENCQQIQPPRGGMFCCRMSEPRAVKTPHVKESVSHFSRVQPPLCALRNVGKWSLISE